MKPATAATTAQPVRRPSLVSKAVRIKTARPVPASQLAAKALMSRAACRVHGRAVAASAPTPPPLRHRNVAAVKSVDELVKINTVPSRMPNWANVFDASSTVFPGRES